MRILEEDLKTINEVRAVEGISTNSDTQRLTKTDSCRLVHRLVGEGSGSRDDADDSLLVNVAGHDSDLAFLGTNDARTIRADESGLVLVDETRLHADHVLKRVVFVIVE